MSPERVVRISISHAKNSFALVLREVAHGARVVITRHGKDVAVFQGFDAYVAMAESIPDPLIEGAKKFDRLVEHVKALEQSRAPNGDPDTIVPAPPPWKRPPPMAPKGKR